MAKITIKGKRCKIVKIPPADNIVHANPARILSKQCPDIIFAKSRNAKDTTRKLYDTTSIATKRGASAIGAPDGKKKDKAWKPCVLIPIIFIPTKAIVAKPSVTTIWLVTVKLKGIIPIKLQKKRKEKIVKIIGKYKLPFFLTFSDKTLK